ncbi:hypothetical protein BGX24_008404 [Mortierella sp. AD032]|nr:hypothetical protein BGX24_008404 [Mortierella sp. AD032]
MNKSARKAVNLSVLQRHDPHISDILDSSSYVVVYKFDEDSQAWTKKGVEGTMFVFRRSTLPSYGFFIMNRLGIDNMMADLTADMALQLTSDYIIYRDERDIHGIWVYEPTDRDRIGEKLMDCCKKSKDEGVVNGSNGVAGKPSPSASSDHSSIHRAQEQPSVVSTSTETAAASDPLSRMLNDAMSKARVSESSGVPSTPQTAQRQLAETSSTHAYSSTPTMSAQNAISSSRSRSSVSQQGSPELRRDTNSPSAATSSPSSGRNEIPSFLLAIISQDNKDASSGSQSGSPRLRRESLKDLSTVESSSTQAMLLNSLTGSGKSVNGDRPGSSSRSHGPPLSAEFLPASVMPSGLYSPASNNNGRPNGAHQGPSAPPGQPQRPSPPPGMANPHLMNRPLNGMAVHGSPLQAPAFAYSPGMMPSPLAMPPMQIGPMMHPPPSHPSAMNGGAGGGGGLHHPPPPPLPFPPMALPMPGQGVPPSFPADAMHAAMGTIGFMQQQQRGFVNRGPPGEVMPKAEFTQQFMGLLQNDPQFMDVLYTNYTAVFARRG